MQARLKAAGLPECQLGYEGATLTLKGKMRHRHAPQGAANALASEAIGRLDLDDQDRGQTGSAGGRAEAEGRSMQAGAALSAAIAATIAQHGLTPEEYGRIQQALGRDPNLVELGIFSVMWSEHCSYKSSRVLLRGLPTSGPRVLQGPGENAGVVDIGDGLAVAFKMESHNHPSYIEPYQGAATGVGGILRDVFTMGARPIAALNLLALRRPDRTPRRRSSLGGVVAGIGGYGNAFGVPTVGGEVAFDASFNGNCLVNAFALGVLPSRQDLPRQRRRASATRCSTWAPAPAATASTAPPWPRPSSAERHRGEAAHRAGGRSLHREAAARGLPRADGRATPWSASRTWARRASPPPRWRWRAAPATGWP